MAVDAATGKEVWKTYLGDGNKGETLTLPPLVVEGKVLVGDSGGKIRVARRGPGRDRIFGREVLRRRLNWRGA